MSWDIDYTREYECPCGKSQYTVVYSSNDWGQHEERWSMECVECENRYRLYEYPEWEAGREHTRKGWITKSLFDTLAGLRQRRYEGGQQIEASMKMTLSERWLAHFEGRNKKAIWEELSPASVGGYPTLSTFYRHCREDGVERVLLRYLTAEWSELVASILGPLNPHLVSMLSTRQALLKKIELVEEDARKESNRLTRA